MSDNRTNKASLAWIACFCVGAGWIALFGRDSLDRTIDHGLVAACSLVAAVVGGALAYRFTAEKSARAKALDAFFGAFSLVSLVFALVEWSNVRLDSSPAQPVAVTAGERVSAGRAGPQRIVTVFGKRWLLSDKLSGSCKNTAELTLDVSAGWLGQRWVRAVRCAPSAR